MICSVVVKVVCYPGQMPSTLLPEHHIQDKTQSRYISVIWSASSEFGTYRLCEQRRFRRACACAQSRQNLRCSLIEAVSQEEPSDRKPDPWPFWIAGHTQLKFVMTECSKTQIRLTRHNIKVLFWTNGTALTYPNGRHCFRFRKWIV